MSIESEILRIQHNIADTYAAVSSKGGNVPLQPNSANLAAAVASIPTDTTVLVNAPIGSILNWSGTEADVPTGWHICNGEDGTLDLRDKFVLGAGTEHAVGSSGGEETHTLTVAEMPQHKHSLNNRATQSGSSSGAYMIMGTNGSGGSILETTEVGSSQSHNNMPPYYALLFIQKISATPTDYVTKAELEDYTPSEVYSTEEQRIGTWIDGKPLYRKVIILNLPKTTSSVATYSGTDLPENSEIVKYEGFCLTTVGSFIQIYAMGYSYISFVGTQIWCAAMQKELISAKVTLIADYTKTTDQAGEG